MANLVKVNTDDVTNLGVLSAEQTFNFLNFDEIKAVYVDESVEKYLKSCNYVSGVHIKMKTNALPLEMLEYFKDCDELWQEEGNMFWVWWD